MPGKYSTLMGTRRATIALFSVFLVLVLVVLVIGLDNMAGLICGNLAFGMLYIVMTLTGPIQYDLTWIVIVILTLFAFVPVLVALFFTVWTATQTSAAQP